MFNLFKFLKNLVQKFNAKLGGINQFVSLMRALTSSSIRSDVFMFFGIDCTHTTCSRERPSIAAVIGSKDSTSIFLFYFVSKNKIFIIRYTICWSCCSTIFS